MRLRRLLIAIAIAIAALVAAPLASAECALEGDGSAAHPFLVSTKSRLALVGHGDCGLDKHYLQTADISWTGESFTPIAGDPGYMTAFSGSYDGGGHVISGLRISSPVARAGMFGTIDGATIEHLTLHDAVVEGVVEDDSAILVGFAATYSASVVIRDVHITGASSITATNDFIGAIIGYGADLGPGGSNTITITDSSSTADVTGGTAVGGIAGKLEFGVAGSSVRRVWQTGTVHGAESSIGGLLGWLTVERDGVALGDSYSTGAVSADVSFAGGVIGTWSNGLITPPTGTVRRVYATGSVSAAGLGVGGAGVAGGLFGSGFETVLDALYDRQTVGLNDFTDNAKTTAQMKDIATYRDAGWGISQGWATPSDLTAWGICPLVNDGYPFLLSAHDAPGPCARETIGMKVVRTFVGRGGLAHAPAPRATLQSNVTVRWRRPSDAPVGTTYTVTWSVNGVDRAVDVGARTSARLRVGNTGEVDVSIESSHGNRSARFLLPASVFGRPVYSACSGSWQALCGKVGTRYRMGKVRQVATFVRSGTRSASVICRGATPAKAGATRTVCRLSTVGRALLRRGPIVVRMTTTLVIGPITFADSALVAIPRIEPS